MPYIHAPHFHITINVRRAQDNTTPTGDFQWQTVIGIIVGFLSILLAVYLLHLLFQFHASGVPRRTFEYVLPSSILRASHSVTEPDVSGSFPDIPRTTSRAPPPPYTARSNTAPLPAITAPPPSFQGGPARHPRSSRPSPRRHVDDLISRA
ncbi:hypothetical protein DEU56DRAFT_503799 [Suillus clintonianus]|uniref:uncharacterized protein n=1 Tax=Suillus clintonianus TaxID=1904413 RepID=UPI001B866077|nr:uncharacterized protein DEU56DRAFT_503799 [Suillus clintonianus]KAG2128682.1 hypothetical protein DEU56DRAFT_503799 [Suillus clintonianus]